MNRSRVMIKMWQERFDCTLNQATAHIRITQNAEKSYTTTKIKENVGFGPLSIPEERAYRQLSSHSLYPILGKDITLPKY